MIKFSDPYKTLKGEERASVSLKALKTLWFNTGTRCNLSCENCYIESNPKNDRLSFITAADVIPYLSEIRENNLKTQEIGLTGGEPFLNPHIIEVIEAILSRGFKTLILTNAFRLNRFKDDLLSLLEKYQDQMIIRISLDHYTSEVHEMERGLGTFQPTLENIKWLFDKGFSIAVAGRSLMGEKDTLVDQGYMALMEEWDISLSRENLVVFPEMDPKGDVPEITTACWDILKRSPDEMMCASSRMIVKRKGEDHTTVLACTLLAYDSQFELGRDHLLESRQSVQLNHPFCAQFCVLGGSSCS